MTEILPTITRHGFYANKDIQFEIIKQLHQRETCFIPYNPEPDEKGRRFVPFPAVRWLQAGYLNMLERHWEQFGFFRADRPMNIYHSLATYTTLPVFSYSYRIKSQQQEVWNREFTKRLAQYDFFFDFDSPDLAAAHKDAMTLKGVLDRGGIRYSLRFSGSKGFHIYISGDDADWWDLALPVYDTTAQERAVSDFTAYMRSLPYTRNGLPMDKILLFKCAAVRLRAVLDLETMDTSVQEVKRVVKVPYSWDVKSGRICYPLTDAQFEQFDKDDYLPLPVLRRGNYKRGLLWRNDTATLDERRARLRVLFQELGIIK